MRKKRRFLYMFFCLCFMFTMMPGTAFAKEADFVPPETAFKNMYYKDGTPVTWPKDVKWTAGIPWMDEIPEIEKADPFPRMAIPFEVTGDIEIMGDTGHDKVYETTKDKKLDVTGTLDVRSIKEAIDYLKFAEDYYERNKPVDLGETQSSFITTLTLPEGILEFPDELVEGSTVVFSGAKDVFKVSKIQKVGNSVRVTFTLAEGIDTFEKLHEKITSVDDTLKITIKGISVGNEAKYDTNYTIAGNTGGYMYARIIPEYNAAMYMVYYTRQTPDGKDFVENEEDITFTLKVKQLNKKVTFISEEKEYAVVDVEYGSSIDKDVMQDQSMPKDPTREGYVFKGWNTKADGSGTAFTGETVVTEDLSVYAIYEKKSDEKIVTPGNGGSENKTKKKAPDHVARPKAPKTGDGNSSVLLVTLMLAAAGSFAGVRRQRNKIPS